MNDSELLQKFNAIKELYETWPTLAVGLGYKASSWRYIQKVSEQQNGRMTEKLRKAVAEYKLPVSDTGDKPGARSSLKNVVPPANRRIRGRFNGGAA